MFDSVLVANRGEIAVRVLRTLRRLGIRGVAVYSDADTGAPHVALADAAVRLGPAPAAQSYLAIERLLDAAARTGAQAIHPGYGFLAESAAFARAVAAAGLTFVGPPPAAIEAMGDKIRAKGYARAAGVPLLPGVTEPGLDDDALAAAGGVLGYPFLIKAAAGGGGRGMRIVRAGEQLRPALAAARREAVAAFGDDELLLERYVERPRHVEIQVLADAHGTGISLGERECSLQRRYQKVIEEAPAPRLGERLRAAMGDAAVALAAAVGYTGVGTVEYLVDGGGEAPVAAAADVAVDFGADTGRGAPRGFAFLEMNTRLQVEHPVTEQVTGLDLVEQQLRVAAGERLAIGPRPPRGHAIEARIYAEDPARGFLPTGGRVLALGLPGGEGVRLDLGITAGTVVGTDYDPLLAKVVAHGADRAEALLRLDRALAGLAVLGVRTNTAFLRRLLAHPDVRAGRLDTGLIGRLLGDGQDEQVPQEAYVVAALAELARLEPAAGTAVDPFDMPTGWRVGGTAATRWCFAGAEVSVSGRSAAAVVTVDGGPPRAAALRRDGDDLVLDLEGRTSHWLLGEAGDERWLGSDGGAWALRLLPAVGRGQAEAAATASGPLRAPLPGTVRLVAVTEGQRVAAGETLLVVEAMKMEHPITAPVDGVVAKLLVRAGQQVPIDAELAVVDPDVQS